MSNENFMLVNEAEVGEQLKANRRMSEWAGRPQGNAHKLIKAFLIAADGRQYASAATMRLLCSDEAEHPELYIRNFGHWFSDLKTETGNASGKVFEQNDDRVTIWEPVQVVFNRYRDRFSV